MDESVLGSSLESAWGEICHVYFYSSLCWGFGAAHFRFSCSFIE
jgi:hypothetical protein